jgi:hypothetical protein
MATALHTITNPRPSRILLLFSQATSTKRDTRHPCLLSCSVKLVARWSGNRRIVTTRYRLEPKRRLSLEECFDLFSRAIWPYRNVMVVLDGLDECENPTQLLQYLRDISVRAQDTVKLFLSSRRNTAMPPDFPTWTKLDREEWRDLTASDMERYIRSQIEDADKLRLGH